MGSLYSPRTRCKAHRNFIGVPPHRPTWLLTKALPVSDHTLLIEAITIVSSLPTLTTWDIYKTTPSDVVWRVQGRDERGESVP